MDSGLLLFPALIWMIGQPTEITCVAFQISGALLGSQATVQLTTRYNCLTLFFLWNYIGLAKVVEHNVNTR